MRLVGRGWYQSLSGAYEEPPATPVGYFSQNNKRFEVLIKEEKMRYQYRQVFLVNYERENRYEILYPPTKRLGKYVSLPFQITDIKSGQEVVRYEETSKTIDYRINEIKKREPTAEYLFTEQN